MRVTLLQYQPGDEEVLLDLSRSVSWPHTREDWRTNLAAGLVYGHRDDTGRAISSAVIHRYPGLNPGLNPVLTPNQPGIASLGMVIVRPEARGLGLGLAATERCLEDADGPIMLVATPVGEPLYTKLGFRTVEHVQNLVAPAGVALPVENHCSIKESDFAKIVGFDRVAFGADRRLLLEHRWSQAAGGSLLPGVDLFDWPRGFGWKIHQNDRLLIGPVIAPDVAGALQLIGNLAAGHSGPVRIDVPVRGEEHGQHYIRSLIGAGFQLGPLRPLMLKGAGGLPGRRERIFATAALAFG